jgi:hypothetical protein
METLAAPHFAIDACRSTGSGDTTPGGIGVEYLYSGRSRSADERLRA